jgi:predicted nucleic acid-binding protein
VIVLVDTSIWSLALRRSRAHISQSQERQVIALEELIQEGRARLLGAVRQELLSSIRHPVQFSRLRDRLRTFPDIELQLEDHERAAELSNTCEAHGVIGSTIDFLLCSAALARNWAIYSADRDVEHYARHIPIALFR